MNWAGAIVGAVENNVALVFLGLAVLVLILLLSVISLHAKLGKLSRRKASGISALGTDVIESLDKGLIEIRNASEKVATLSDYQDALASRQSFCIQKIGLIKFNAFDDMGGEQSFALALLDAQDNGVLISSLLSRTESRTYAKAITSGKSEQTLSKEEQDALSRALKM